MGYHIKQGVEEMPGTGKLAMPRNPVGNGDSQHPGGGGKKDGAPIAVLFTVTIRFALS